jgi:hypothetical protein
MALPIPAQAEICDPARGELDAILDVQRQGLAVGREGVRTRE